MKHLFFFSFFPCLLISLLNAQSETRNKGTSLSDTELSVFSEGNFEGMPYRLLLPLNFDKSKTYPLILNLHGRAGIGDDNRSSLRPWSRVFTTDAWRKKYPCIMVAPQSWDSWSIYRETIPTLTQAQIKTFPKSWQEWSDRFDPEIVSTASLTMAFLLVDKLCRDYKVDTKRIYVLGHSMGGFGSWNAIWAAPERFAAAIPSAGGLYPWKDVSRFKDVPIWAFHGADDPTVPYEFSQSIFDQMKALHGNMKLTEMAGVGHGVANYGFVFEGDDASKGRITHYSSNRCDKTENVWDWLFRQKRK